MSEELIRIRMRLTGAKQAAAETKGVAVATRSLGLAGKVAGAGMTAMGKGAMFAGRAAMFAGRWIRRGAMAIGLFALVEIPRMVNAYRESWKVTRATNQQIQRTGGIANVTASEVGDLANALSLKTGIDDEQIQSVSNLLLTFRNIRNEVGKNNDIFDQATRTALDMAAAYEVDLSSAAKMLGKALQDPAGKASALGRTGAIDEAGVERLEAMEENGASLIAMQKSLLDSINKMGGIQGRAAAIADPFDRLKVSWENLEEAGGSLLFPMLSKGANALAKFFNQMRSGKGAGGDFVDFLGNLKAKGAAAIGWVRGGVRWVGRFVGRLKSGKGQVGEFGEDIGEFGKTIADIGKFMVNVFQKALPGIKQNLSGVIRIVGGVVKIVGGILRGDWSRVWQGAKDIVKGVIDAVIGTIKMLTAPFRVVFGGAANFLKEVFGGAFQWIGDKIDWLADRVNDVTSLLPGTSEAEENAFLQGLQNEGIVPGGDNGDRPRRPTGPSNDDISGRPRMAIRKLATIKAGGSGRRVIEIPVNLNGAEIARVVHEEIENDAARAGLMPA